MKQDSQDRKSRAAAPPSGGGDFTVALDSGLLKADRLFVYPDLLSRVSPLYTEARFGPVPFGGTPGLFFDGGSVPPQPYPNVTVGTTEAVRSEREAEMSRQAPPEGAEG